MYQIASTQNSSITRIPRASWGEFAWPVVSRASTNRARLSHDPHTYPADTISAAPSRRVAAIIVTYHTLMPWRELCTITWTRARDRIPPEKLVINADMRPRWGEVTRKCNIPSSTVVRYGLVVGVLENFATRCRRWFSLEIPWGIWILMRVIY